MCIVSTEDERVIARLYNPQSFNGSRADTRTGRLDLRLRPEALVGLHAPRLAALIAAALLDRLTELYGPPEAPAPLDRGHGVEHVDGQLRLDLPQ